MPPVQPLADPSGSSAIVAAVRWLEATLLGTIATTVAVIAVASIGFAMLAGRVDIRRGATAIIGCFVLFGATSIVAGIRSASNGFGVASSSADMIGVPVPVAHVATPAPPPSPHPAPPRYDPYAGASMPTR